MLVRVPPSAPPPCKLTSRLEEGELARNPANVGLLAKRRLAGRAFKVKRLTDTAPERGKLSRSFVRVVFPDFRLVVQNDVQQRITDFQLSIVLDIAQFAKHPDAAVTSLIPSLSCRSCRPNAPFAELVRLSRTSITDEMRIERTRRVLGE